MELKLKGLAGIGASILILCSLWFTQSLITVNDVFLDKIDYSKANYPLIITYRISYYLSIFLFLQCSIIFISGEYNKIDSNILFWLQLTILLLSEGGALIQSFI